MEKENTKKANKKKKIDPDLHETEEFLRSYGLGKKLLFMDEYERTFGGRSKDSCIWTPEETRQRMAQVRAFVLSLDNREEKLLLYLHYIKGENMERCSELLDVNRSTVYRMRQRGLALAAQRRKEMQKEGGRP